MRLCFQDIDHDGRVSIEDYTKAVVQDKLLMEALGPCLPNTKVCITKYVTFLRFVVAHLCKYFSKVLTKYEITNIIFLKEAKFVLIRISFNVVVHFWLPFFVHCAFISCPIDACCDIFMHPDQRIFFLTTCYLCVACVCRLAHRDHFSVILSVCLFICLSGHHTFLCLCIFKRWNACSFEQ